MDGFKFYNHPLMLILMYYLFIVTRYTSCLFLFDILTQNYWYRVTYGCTTYVVY